MKTFLTAIFSFTFGIALCAISLRPKIALKIWVESENKNPLVESERAALHQDFDKFLDTKYGKVQFQKIEK